MSDFATEIICQANPVIYSSFIQVGRKESCDSAVSTCDSSIELYSNSTPKALSPDGSFSSPNGSYPRFPQPFVRVSDLENCCESEFKYYKPRRASSLKTNRTPPGTPKSKAVRFADALGLDLEDVRHVFNQELPPKIPASAVQDLELDNEQDSSLVKESVVNYVTNFTQPGAAPDFLRRVRMHNVVLENSAIEDNVLSGSIRVMSITYDKKVSVRVTFNDWKSSVDFNALYVVDSHDGLTDRFAFSFVIPYSYQTYGSRIQFAISYECSNGAQYWDNNFGQNYTYTWTTESMMSLNYR